MHLFYIYNNLFLKILFVKVRKVRLSPNIELFIFLDGGSIEVPGQLMN
jgi:hypothetical protein